MRDNNSDYPYNLSMCELLKLQILYDTIKHTIRLMKLYIEYSSEENSSLKECLSRLERDIKPFNKLITKEKFGLKYEK